MSSSPTAAKATEKEHKGNKEDNFSPYLRSIRWKEELAKSKSEIVRAVELSKLANGVVFVLEKRITKPPMSQKKSWVVGSFESPCSSRLSFHAGRCKIILQEA